MENYSVSQLRSMIKIVGGGGWICGKKYIKKERLIEIYNKVNEDYRNPTVKCEDCKKFVKIADMHWWNEDRGIRAEYCEECYQKMKIELAK